jgi:hypothetical protein
VKSSKILEAQRFLTAKTKKKKDYLKTLLMLIYQIGIFTGITNYVLGLDNQLTPGSENVTNG